MINGNHFRGKIGGSYTFGIGNKVETCGKKNINVWESENCAYLWGAKSKKQNS